MDEKIFVKWVLFWCFNMGLGVGILDLKINGKLMKVVRRSVIFVYVLGCFKVI